MIRGVETLKGRFPMICIFGGSVDIWQKKNSCDKLLGKILPRHKTQEKYMHINLDIKHGNNFLSCHTKMMPVHLYSSYTDKIVYFLEKKVVRFGSHLHLNKSVAFRWFSADEEIPAELL